MAGVKSILSAEMGTPKETVKVERKTFVSIASGDFRVTFGTIAWPNENRTAHQDPIVILEGTASKYLNEKGYKIPFSIGSTFEEIRALANAFNQIADLMEKYEGEVKSDTKVVSDTAAADAFVSKKK